MSDRVAMRLGLVAFAVLAGFMISSGHANAGNWLLGTPPAWIVQSVAVVLLIAFATGLALVSYLRMRELREIARESGDEPAVEAVTEDNVLPFAHRPAPPTAPIPTAPAVGDD